MNKIERLKYLQAEKERALRMLMEACIFGNSVLVEVYQETIADLDYCIEAVQKESYEKT